MSFMSDTGRHRGLRWAGAAVVLLLAALLVVASVVARFARGELLDDDRYVSTVAPLATDPAVQDAIVNRVTDEVVTRIDIPALVQQAASAVDIRGAEQLAPLVAGPISDFVESFVRKEVNKFVHSERFPVLWAEANRLAHRALDVVLTGEDGRYVSTQGTEIVVDLGPLVTQIKQRIAARGLTVVNQIPEVSIPFTVADVEQLPRIQRAVHLLDLAATWLPIIALLLLGCAVWLAPDRRRALLIGCVLIAVLLLALLVANRVARGVYEDGVAAAGRNVPAALSIYDTLLRYLISAVWTVIAVAVLGALWLWLAGPGRVPVAFRRLANRGPNAAAAAIGRAGWSLHGAGRFAARFQAWIGGVIALLALWLVLRNPSVATAVWVTLLAAVLAAALAVVRRTEGET